ncbi:hypothetical protein DUNSADRAFT_7395 [Dunaliella salina]|uniref:Uncharacterized protein n=1 Tax=Dunaliella salina TaxID=3046 RepID=A0ABQ7H6I3_DUNSA|nr:hypothetical protein DUNSADRAFT_7395 [Dunaliella salina]|eukprot:KAF5842411.1 hypothetical protein DUNSADRAFT_7395 [Dunaliella salina]
MHAAGFPVIRCLGLFQLQTSPLPCWMYHVPEVVGRPWSTGSHVFPAPRHLTRLWPPPSTPLLKAASPNKPRSQAAVAPSTPPQVGGGRPGGVSSPTKTTAPSPGRSADGATKAASAHARGVRESSPCILPCTPVMSAPPGPVSSTHAVAPQPLNTCSTPSNPPLFVPQTGGPHPPVSPIMLKGAHGPHNLHQASLGPKLPRVSSTPTLSTTSHQHQAPAPSPLPPKSRPTSSPHPVISTILHEDAYGSYNQHQTPWGPKLPRVSSTPTLSTASYQHQAPAPSLFPPKSWPPHAKAGIAAATDTPAAAAFRPSHLNPAPIASLPRAWDLHIVAPPIQLTIRPLSSNQSATPSMGTWTSTSHTHRRVPFMSVSGTEDRHSCPSPSTTVATSPQRPLAFVAARLVSPPGGPEPQQIPPDLALRLEELLAIHAQQYKGYLFEVLLGGAPAPSGQVKSTGHAAQHASAITPAQEQARQQQQGQQQQQRKQQQQQQQPPFRYTCHPLHARHFISSSSSSSSSGRAYVRPGQEGLSGSQRRASTGGETALPGYCLAFESTLDAVRFCHASQARAGVSCLFARVGTCGWVGVREVGGV